MLNRTELNAGQVMNSNRGSGGAKTHAPRLVNRAAAYYNHSIIMGDCAQFPGKWAERTRANPLTTETWAFGKAQRTGGRKG